MLERYIDLDLQARAKETIASVPRDLLARTAAFLLLKDSRSRFAIEGERAPPDRIQRWGRAIGNGGRKPIDLDELLRLQRIVIGDARFVRLGLRTEGGFVGAHDRDTRMPIPDHISARPDDLVPLMEGLVAFDASGALDPVLAAATLAFGFVCIHPFEDGNGRLHRDLIHDVLAQRGFNPPGVVVPISSAILERIDEYRRELEDYSQRLLPLICWEVTDQGNVRVLNDTGDFYRFLMLHRTQSFCMAAYRRPLMKTCRRKLWFLRRYDAFRDKLSMIVDMPGNLSDLLFQFLHQNDGRLSRRGLTEGICCTD